jgi:hypothetical protein
VHPTLTPAKTFGGRYPGVGFRPAQPRGQFSPLSALPVKVMLLSCVESLDAHVEIGGSPCARTGTAINLRGTGRILGSVAQYWGSDARRS